ncbi:TPA: hypothetical protein ONC42_000502 [Enterobacter kobei]|nr:hypothetical protein [Enterobacter kobei]
MKLIDILVERLPALGGWPIDSDDERALLSSLPGVSWGLNGGGYYAFRGPNDSITYQQYESARVASKPEWDGVGLPPVGTECEYSLNAGRTWFKCKIDYVLGTQGLIMLADVYEGGQFVGFAEYDGKLKFRPIRSEEDKKRDEIIEALKEGLGHAHGLYDLMQIYHLLNNGKIPHIRID